ncbi:MAG: isochorismatase, partial [Anaerolineales bacterium]
FTPKKVGQVWRVPYEERAAQARQWAQEHDIRPATQDKFKIVLVAVDVQNTFCIPEFELYVGGRSGTGAVDDNVRLCQFIYRNLACITQVAPTLDTHTAMQIFHAVFLVDDEGNHPGPLTLISAEDIHTGRWKFNPALAGSLGVEAEHGQSHLTHYTAALQARGKYALTIWPYHAMLGGIGHALVPAFEEAVFFHSIARYSPPDFIVKGDNPFTEHYSAVGPEVLDGPTGEQIARRNSKFIEKLRQFDAVIIAGQAKSHCVAWTINDILEDIRAQDKSLAGKVYLLEDCTSPVVVPGVVDFTGQADEAFRRFAEAGMHVVRSTEPIEGWPGFGK